MANRFETKEAIRKSGTTAKTTAAKMTEKKPAKKSMMSMNVDPELYEKFKYITKKLGTNASAVLNEAMYTYVKEHGDLI